DICQLSKQTDASSKIFAQFLNELSKHIPDHLILYIDTLTELFDSDYLRKDLLVLIVDQYFIDINVHVRSHALQLCGSLVEINLLPVVFYCHLAKATIERMNDISCIVRKYAIQLATKLIKHNPYTNEFLPCNIMIDEYRNEMNKLICLETKLCEILDIKNVKVDESTSMTVINDIDDNDDNKNILFKKMIDQQHIVCSMYNDDDQFIPFERYNAEMDKSIKYQSQLISLLMSGENNDDTLDNIENREYSLGEVGELLNDMIKQQRIVCYLYNANEFCNLFRHFLNVELIYLLKSKISSDVLEIIEFLIIWSSFDSYSSDYKQNEQNLFSLIWSTDKNITAAVIDAFKRIYLNIDNTKIKDERISHKNIIEKLLLHIDVDFDITFEHILKQLFDRKEINVAFIDVLYDYYLMMTIDNNYNNKYMTDDFYLYLTGDKHRQCLFLKLVSLVIDYSPDILWKHVDKIIDNLLLLDVRHHETNLVYIRYQLEILYHLFLTHLNDRKQLTYLFYDTIITKLINDTTSINDWIPCMKQFLNLLFISEKSKILSIEIGMRFIHFIVEKLRSTSINHSDDRITWFENLKCTEQNKTLLIKLLATVNVFLINQVRQVNTKINNKNKHSVTNGNVLEITDNNLLIDDDVFVEQKKKLKKQSSDIKNKIFPQKPFMTINGDDHDDNDDDDDDDNNDDGDDDDDDDDDDNEMNDLTDGCEQQDSDQIYLQQQFDLTQLENEDSLVLLVERWLDNFFIDVQTNVYDSEEDLVMTAIMTLTRYMFVSPQLCSKYVNRTFQFLNTCPYAGVRSALIVSLGDLLLRHPNIIEPYTPEFYKQIHDKDISVSETTLCTIAVLILREMIKVRGYISEIAICLLHSNVSIASLAYHFFSELSVRNRGLALFNVMPDIISRLSTMNSDVNGNINDNINIKMNSTNEGKLITLDMFHQIIAHLFQYVKNDRQCEILVKKLCRQFKLSCDDRKRQNIAYCLSKLNIKSQNSYKILKEHFPMDKNDHETNIDDLDNDECLAWKKYLMPVLNEIERRLKQQDTIIISSQ
ncbi:unnamed protein product, partial [Didymodactylos carnosus]